MNTIDMARELGKAIQMDERYARYHAAREKNDQDEALQKMIGDFNLKRMDLNAEMQKEERDSEKLTKLDGEIKELYSDIMKNENMNAYNDAKTEMDDLLSQINIIITMSANGEDPMTCSTEQSGCSGSCSTCGGCH